MYLSFLGHRSYQYFIYIYMMWGACTANMMAFAISSACSASICFVLSTYFSNALSVIAFRSSVVTTPGSIHVTRMLDLWLNSCLRPSLNAVMACFVAQYTLPAG